MKFTAAALLLAGVSSAALSECISNCAKETGLCASGD